MIEMGLTNAAVVWVAGRFFSCVFPFVVQIRVTAARKLNCFLFRSRFSFRPPPSAPPQKKKEKNRLLRQLQPICNKRTKLAAKTVDEDPSCKR